MPTDIKRLPTPEDSQTPYIFKTKQHAKLPLVDALKIRQDGRRCDQGRSIFLRCGVVEQAKGSAYIEMQQTKVMCSVYGPREVKRREDFSMKGQLMCELKFATFACRQRKGHQPDQKDKSYSLIVQEALEPAVLLEKFPKARIDIFILVLQDDGSALSAAINCAAVAMASAGIEMYDLVTSATLRIHDNLHLFDPTKDEDYSSKREVGEEGRGSDGAMMVGLMPSLNQISALVQTGDLPADAVKQGLQRCMEYCHKIYPVLQRCLEKAVRGRLATDTSPGGRPSG